MFMQLTIRHVQFLTFALIGVVNTFVHGSLLVVAVEYFGANVVMAHLMAFCIANLFSYVMNSKLTFKIHMSLILYIRFFVASMMALGLTLLLSWLMDLFGFHYLFGFVLIVVLVPIFSFILMKFWTFTDSNGDQT